MIFTIHNNYRWFGSDDCVGLGIIQWWYKKDDDKKDDNKKDDDKEDDDKEDDNTYQWIIEQIRRINN